MSEISKWTLTDYFDVWGNEVDGWEVNDASIWSTDIELKDDMTDEEIIDYLISVNYLTPDAKGIVQLVDGGDWIEIENSESSGQPGYPLGRLDRRF